MVLATFALLEATFQVFPTLLPDRLSYAAHRKFIKNYGDLRTMFHRSAEPTSTLFRYHETLGWIGKAGLDLRQWSLDGEFELTTNSLGFRDREWGPLDRSRTRIVVLGDSFIWGLPIDQDALLPQRLERELNDAGYAVDVYNLGINGYGTDQEYLAFREYGADLAPDIVVLSFFYSNDFWNNGSSVSSKKAKPYFAIGDDGALELRNVPVPQRAYRDGVVAAGHEADAPAPGHEPIGLGRRIKDQLHARTVLYPLLVGVVRGSRPADVPSNAIADDGEGRQLAPDRIVTREIIRKLAAEVKGSGAELLVLLFPGYGFDRGARADYEAAARFFRQELPEIRLLDLTPAFEATSERLYGPFIEHWTRSGSRLAAAKLAEFLQQNYGDRLIRRAQADPGPPS